MHSDGPPSVPAAQPPHCRWHRLGLLATLVLVASIVVSLPVTMLSMRNVLGRTPRPVYDLLTGQQLTSADVVAAASEAVHVNLSLVDLTEGSGLVTIAVSGKRTCARACAALALTLTALDVEVEEERGVPPSTTLTLTPTDRNFSETAQLPVRGQPSLYPYDEYHVLLAVAGAATEADGTTRQLDPTIVAASGTITLQNRISELVMPPPAPIDPRVLPAGSDSAAFMAVQSVRLERPAYIQRMSVTLLVLIAISATLAVFTRGFNELMLGIGGLILGVWGVRSVLMPQPLPVVTTVDLALSWVIFLLLFGLSLRAAMHFYRHSGLPAPAWPSGHSDA